MAVMGSLDFEGNQVRDRETLTCLKHHPVQTAFAVVFWLCFVLYVLTIPWTSNYFNNKWYRFDAYSHRKGLCTEPAANFVCVDGQNFTELALKYRGVPVGCGCGQGIFGEALCPLDGGIGYSLSTLVSTGPGTGALCSFSSVPLMLMWMHHEHVVKTFLKKGGRWSRCLEVASLLTMIAFQVGYGLFLFFTDCTFPVLHQKMTLVWIVSMALHVVVLLIIVAFRERQRTVTFREPEFWIIFVMALLSLILILLTVVPSIIPSLLARPGFGHYLFWFGEATSLSLLFGIAPMLMLLVGPADSRNQESLL